MTSATVVVKSPEPADIWTSSDEYARRFSGAVGDWFLKVQAETTLRALERYSAARILDVGGGHGQLAGVLVDNGFEVTVLGSAEVCGERIRHLLTSGRCRFVTGDILSLPFPDRAFDVVISYRLLSHVDEWERFLAELSRVAECAVVVDYPSVRSLNCLYPYLFGLKRRLEGNTRHFRPFAESWLSATFESCGFELVGRYPQFFLPMVFHRMVKSLRASLVIESFARRVGLTDLFGSPVVLQAARKETLR